MFLEKLDLLSPNLTLNFKGKKSHQSICSGLLTILTILISGIFVITSFYEFLTRKNPTANYFIQNIDDVGEFPMNSKAVFHYTYYENRMKYEPSIYVFIGFSNLLNSEYKSHEYNYTKLDHYIYEPCNEDSNDLNMNKLNNIVDKENYLNYGLCISKFYNATSKKNISITDKSFVYPMMSKGFANEVFDLYSIYFQKCINNSDYNNNSCNSAENINDYFGGVLSPLKFKIINQEIDIENFKNPIIHKILTMRTDFGLKTWSIQNLNFKPLILDSDDGYIITKINHFNSFNYEQNDMENEEDDYGIFDAKVFWMRNTCLIYERKYKKLSDVLGYLGGIFKIISMIAEGINILF